MKTIKFIDGTEAMLIVRCEECKYEAICSHSVQHTTHEITSATTAYRPIDFCSYGERKESE